jgi:hypothetical protein
MNDIYNLKDDDSLTLTGKQLREWKDKITQELIERIESIDICANESPMASAEHEVLMEEIKKVILTGKGECFEIKTYNDGLKLGREQAQAQERSRIIEFLKKIKLDFEVLNLKITPDSSEEDYEEASDRIVGALKNINKIILQYNQDNITESKQKGNKNEN